MPGPRDWQDAYYDGDDLEPEDEQLFPIDDEDDVWDDDEDGFVLDLFDHLMGVYDEEEDYEHGIE